MNTSWLKNNLSQPARYTLAVGIFVAALFLRLAIAPLASGYPFITFFPATIIVFYLCGTRPGILMVVLSASSALFLFINPFWRTSLGYEGIIATVFFVVPTLLLGWIISWLQQANNYFIRILEHAPIGMAANALDGHFMLVNQAFCDMLGYTKDELYKLNFQDVTFSEDKNLTMAVRQQLLNGELDTYQIEKRYIRKDGQVVF